MAPFQSVLDLIGNTPLVEISQLSPNPRARIFAKLEGQNPGGSVKDRASKWMIEDAEKNGSLKPGQVILESSSGNTGIALAMIAKMRGYPFKVVLPENVSIERRQLLEVWGAEIIDSPGSEGSNGAMNRAKALAAENPDWFFPFQYANPANPQAPSEGTGPEIWRDTGGDVSHFVSAMGTTGTIMGVSRYLKEQNPDIQIVGLQPDDGSKIPGIRRWPTEYLPRIFERERVDSIIDISQKDAEHCMRELSRIEGISCGASSGGAVHAALNLSATLDNAVIVVIICDRADRYLSSGVFAAE